MQNESTEKRALWAKQLLLGAKEVITRSDKYSIDELRTIRIMSLLSQSDQKVLTGHSNVRSELRALEIVSAELYKRTGNPVYAPDHYREIEVNISVTPGQLQESKERATLELIYLRYLKETKSINPDHARSE